MKLYELISEARRNPSMNIKAEGHEAAVNFLKCKGSEIRNYGVSMTTLPKLGINPGSRYNTPVGVYFYPADYYVSKAVGMRYNGIPSKLPFQHDAPYIQVFELTGNVEDIDKISQNVYTEYVRKLYQNVGKISTLINKSEKETTDLLSKTVLNGMAEAKNNSYGGHLWYLIYTLSINAGTNKRSNAPPRSSVVWNAIIRLIGIDVLIDDGMGIIHENEPYQGVALDPRGIKHINTFHNVETGDNSDNVEIIMTLANKDVGENAYSDYVRMAVNAIRDYDLKYTPKSRKECKIIIDKCLSVLRARPQLYTNLGKENIDFLLQLNSDPNIKQEMNVSLYARSFPELQKELNEMIEQWDEEKAYPGYVDAPLDRKKRTHALCVPEYKIKGANRVIKELTPFKNDPRAKEMINFISNALIRLEFN